MNKFSQEISNFEKNGTYEYIFDEGGNLVFNKSSPSFNKNYVSIPILNYVYNRIKIESFYDLNFLEFIPTSKAVVPPNEASLEMANLEKENQSLKDSLIKLTDVSNENITESEKLAIKQVILDLRIKLKQGVASYDFSEAFPYLPITKSVR